MSRPITRAYISYRREDDPVWAHLLKCHLENEVTGLDVCLDMSPEVPEERLATQRIENLRNADVVIAVVGRRWAGGALNANSLPLSNPRDPIRTELEQAIENEIEIKLVLLPHANFSPLNLPEELHKLRRLHPTELKLDDWRVKLEPLVELLQSTPNSPH